MKALQPILRIEFLINFTIIIIIFLLCILYRKLSQVKLYTKV
jgi:hypothetical protein